MLLCRGNTEIQGVLPLGMASQKEATERKCCVAPDGTQEGGGDVAAGT